MQVKKYEAASVLDALRQVKEDLGPDAIILSSQEAKRTVGGSKRFVVVAAISEQQYQKKELAKNSLGDIYENRLKSQPASHQKAFLDNYYRGLEEKYQRRAKQKTQVPYHQINDEIIEETEDTTTKNVPAHKTPEPMVTSGPESQRVKNAAAEALRSSLSSQFFSASEKLAVPLEQEQVWPQALQNMFVRLKGAGLDKSVNEKWRQQAYHDLKNEAGRKSSIDSWYAKRILSTTRVCEDVHPKKVNIFVGPRGSGKSSSLVKLATQSVIKKGLRLAMITTDVNRVGAVEQLRTYGRILNAPVHVIRDPAELVARLHDLADYDRIYIDTPGISMSDIDELDFIRSLSALKHHFDCCVHLVLSATTKDKDLGGLIKRFQVANFDDVIMTNIDQTTQHGILLNTQLLTDKPFHSFGIGMDVIDGQEMATRERVLDLIFKLTQKSGERDHDSRL